MPSAEYYLKQAQVAARLALTEADPEKARVLNVLSMEYFRKAEQAKPDRNAGTAKAPEAALIHKDAPHHDRW